MTPGEILSHIQNTKASAPTAATATQSFSAAANTNYINDTQGSSSNVASMFINKIRGSIEQKEAITRKALIGEASLVDILTTTTETKNLVNTTVKVRDEFLKAYDKVFNMNM
jgi:flagellar hook-basal body complex protein FliE